VAIISRLFKVYVSLAEYRLFYRFSKETYVFREPTNRSHPIDQFANRQRLRMLPRNPDSNRWSESKLESGMIVIGLFQTFHWIEILNVSVSDADFYFRYFESHLWGIRLFLAFLCAYRTIGLCKEVDCLLSRVKYSKLCVSNMRNRVSNTRNYASQMCEICVSKMRTYTWQKCEIACQICEIRSRR